MDEPVATTNRIGAKATPKFNPAQREMLNILEDMSGQPKEEIITEALKLFEEARVRTQPIPAAKAADMYGRVAGTLQDMDASTPRGGGVAEDDVMALMMKQLKFKMVAQMMREMDGGGSKDNSDARLMSMRAEQMMRDDAASRQQQQLMQTLLMTKLLSGNDGGSGGGNKEIIEVIKSQMAQAEKAQEQSNRRFEEYIREQSRLAEKAQEAEERRGERDEWNLRLAEAQAKTDEALAQAMQNKEQTIAANHSQVEELKQMVAHSYADMQNKMAEKLDGIAAAGKATEAATELQRMMAQIGDFDEMVKMRAGQIGMKTAEANTMILQAKDEAGIDKSWGESAERAFEKATPLLKEVNKTIELILSGGNKGGGGGRGTAPPPPPDGEPTVPPNFVDLTQLSQKDRENVESQFPEETREAIRKAKSPDGSGRVTICKDHLLPEPCRVCTKAPAPMTEAVTEAVPEALPVPDYMKLPTPLPTTPETGEPPIVQENDDIIAVGDVPEPPPEQAGEPADSEPFDDPDAKSFPPAYEKDDKPKKRQQKRSK